MTDENKNNTPLNDDQNNDNDISNDAGNDVGSDIGGEEFRDDLDDRLQRLGGEPAPAITPEEFARLQKAGQVHIDSRGRVRTARRSGSEAGVSLRKRRAWYSA
jgi:hypothetical protein